MPLVAEIILWVVAFGLASLVAVFCAVAWALLKDFW